MTADPAELVRAFAAEFGGGDVRRLAAYLTEDVRAQFAETAVMEGRRSVIAFLRRLFQTYPVRELQLLKCVSDLPIVIVEAVYIFAFSKAPAVTLQAIIVFEIRDGGIASWTDYADLDDASREERARWRRLATANW